MVSTMNVQKIVPKMSWLVPEIVPKNSRLVPIYNYKISSNKIYLAKHTMTI